jgi:hypothetical protein
MVEPEPVRDNPVPLTVRRHTEQSMSIWRANLLNALPADLPDEDRERIVDALLNTTITMSTELRRKRLIDRLMEAAEALEDLGARPLAQLDGSAPDYQEWSALMLDAAEEIRSIAPIERST